MITPPNLVAERAFLHRVVASCLRRGWLRREDSVLVTCGGAWDDRVLEAAGLENRLVTSLDASAPPDVRSYRQADAEDLPFEDLSFDAVIVNDGLHHCASPHRGLAEMYRVARRTVLVVESQDSPFMRAAVALGLSARYELDAVRAHAGRSGGVRNGPVPNHVYRWTRREIEKTLRSLDAEREPRLEYFSEFSFRACHLDGELGRHAAVRLVGPRVARALARAAVAAASVLLPRQGNAFATVILKSEARPHPWIVRDAEGRGRLAV